MSGTTLLYRPDSFTEFSKKQLIVKIMYDITRYTPSDSQVKLSLLQDLIILLLPDVTEGSTVYRQLMSVRCHTTSEEVVQWVDKMARVYIEDPHVQLVLDGMTDEQLSKPY